MLKKDELATATSCLNRAADDEPLFVIRAHDPSAPSVVAAWARDYLESKGGYKNAPARSIAKYEEALQLAGEMRIWQMQNGGAMV
jgi:hypothetical protein